MKKAFLLAHPAGHSISPAMHNAAFKHLGIDAYYQALDVAPEDLADVVEGFRSIDVYGSNVTIPHKLAVKPLMDELSDAARAIGAVNTIVNKQGRLLGHNTDAVGFLQALKQDGGFEPKDKNVVMLGAGGAARAVAYALLTAGVKSLAVFNRTEAKAHALADELANLGSVSSVEDKRLDFIIANTDLLVNTTSVGMEHGGVDPDESPLPKGLLPKNGFLCDIVYRPEKTRLLRDAEAAGLKTQNGLPMLIYQGLEAFYLWTKEKPPASVMLEAARKALS